MNEQVPQVLAGILGSGFDRATNAAMQARQLNTSMDNSAANRQMSAIQGLLGTGGMQQGLAQRSLDLPHEALQRIAAFVPGGQDTNYWSSTEGSQPDNSPGFIQQLLGGGLTLAGMGTGGGSTIGGDLLKKLLG